MDDRVGEPLVARMTGLQEVELGSGDPRPDLHPRVAAHAEHLRGFVLLDPVNQHRAVGACGSEMLPALDVTCVCIGPWINDHGDAVDGQFIAEYVVVLVAAEARRAHFVRGHEGVVAPILHHVATRLDESPRRPRGLPMRRGDNLCGVRSQQPCRFLNGLGRRPRDGGEIGALEQRRSGCKQVPVVLRPPIEVPAQDLQPTVVVVTDVW